MMDKIKISRLSNLALNMARHYGPVRIFAIAAILVVVSTVSGAGVGSLVRAETVTRPVFCVLVPHFKDEYWLSVAFGLEREAEIRGVGLRMYEAGGYKARDTQIDQIESCVDQNVDAILLGAVTSDHPDLLEAVSRAASEIPVFGLVNELHSRDLSGRIGVDWRDMGLMLGQHLTVQFPSDGQPHRAVLISGPSESGWVEPLETGLRDGLSKSAVSIIEVLGADTGLRQQLDLVEIALAKHRDIDILIGSAPAIEAAMGLLATGAISEKPILVSTYISHTVKRGLLNGVVSSVPFDNPTKQGALAITQALEYFEIGTLQPLIGPDIKLIDRSTMHARPISLSPSDFFPTID